MLKEMKDKVENYPSCLTLLRRAQRETLINVVDLTRPWQITTADLFTYDDV